MLDLGLRIAEHGLSAALLILAVFMLRRMIERNERLSDERVSDAREANEQIMELALGLERSNQNTELLLKRILERVEA